MMSVAQRVGLDIGASPVDDARIQAAADAGARLVRLHFPLNDRSHADAEFLAEARRSVESARGARLKVLGVLDGALTVAPTGAGTWADDAPPVLAAAWTEELAGNAERLVGALAGLVAAWEIAPAPNLLINGARRISPARWAAILGAVGTRTRAADPAVSIVAGGLVSDEFVDGVTYFREASEAGGWALNSAPFDAIGLVLRVAPEGGGSESIVKTLVSERAQRLWRTAVALIGEDRIDGLWVTSVAWDAVRAGESAQARNLWTTCDTLTADPLIRSVIWSGLSDIDGATGLFSSSDLSPDSRRPAWKALNDFAVYAAQIGVASNAGLNVLDPEPLETAPVAADPLDIDPEPLEAAAVEADPLDFDPEPLATAPVEADPLDIDPEPLATAPVEADPLDIDPEPIESAHVDVEPVEARPVDIDAEPVDVGPVDARPVDQDADEAPARRIVFSVPRITDLLQAAGLEGSALETALDSVAGRYGSREWLPAGEYVVEIAHPRDDHQTRETDALIGQPTNQQVLSAFYRAGGGTWSLLAKAGLDLADLVTARSSPYDGPAFESLSHLDHAEAQAIALELERGA